jgi:ADP-heptose:LPS heptosyltransferase
VLPTITIFPPTSTSTTRPPPSTSTTVQ